MWTAPMIVCRYRRTAVSETDFLDIFGVQTANRFATNIHTVQSNKKKSRKPNYLKNFKN